MRLLIRYLHERRWLVARVAFCALSQQAFTLLDPYIFRRLIDDYPSHVENSSTSQFLTWAGLWLSGAAAAALAAWVAKSFLLDLVNRIAKGVGLQIYSDALRHSLGMPYSAFEARESGDLMSMLQTARQDIERFTTMLLDSGFTAIASLSLVLAYSSRLNWMLLPAFLLAGPPLLYATFLLGSRTRETQRLIVAETSRMAGSGVESLRNIEIVKSLGLSRQEASRLELHSGRLLELETRKIRYTRYLTFFHGACVHGLRFAMTLVFFYLVYTRQITTGEVFMLLAFSYYFFAPMQDIGRLATQYQEAETSLRNMDAILKTPQESRPANPVPLGPLQSISFRDVRFQYPAAAKSAVDNISFNASRGETIAFVGPSGSGKTTLVKLLAGLYSPDSGEIHYNGIPAARIDPDHLRERLGLVTQDTQLFSGTIRDNLLFAQPDASGEDCLDVLQLAAANDLLQRTPAGLDTVIGESGVRVSGGERQRISIARALLRNPEILVFDEATASLDSLTEEEIVRTMKAVHQRRRPITILIAHRLSTVRHADRIYVLNRGCVQEMGTHAELLEHCGLYHDLWQQQTGGALAPETV